MAFVYISIVINPPASSVNTADSIFFGFFIFNFPLLTFGVDEYKKRICHNNQFQTNFPLFTIGIGESTFKINHKPKWFGLQQVTFDYGVRSKILGLEKNKIFNICENAQYFFFVILFQILWYGYHF